MDGKTISAAVELLLDQCDQVGLAVRLVSSGRTSFVLAGPGGERITIAVPGELPLLEQALQGLTIDFPALPLLTVGESKEIRLLTPKITVAKLLPSLYSFTNNRYGQVPGTEIVRARFSAGVFREMARRPGPRHLANAFVGLIDSAEGPLLAEHRVEPGNIEVRVKRYHIGSPLHRYLYTENYATAFGGPPLARWTRFERPLVCFDWRHPLQDEHGNRLADEPLPDDYAALWIDEPHRAKRLARDTFEWIEHFFALRGLKLIDICFFIDRTGSVIFGEISPDCMRVRSQASDDGEALDKDEWRSGGDAQAVLGRYRRLQELVFSPTPAPVPIAA